MIKTILPFKKNHIALNAAHDISEICKPLKILGIISFNYVKTYHDGSQINLSTSSEWVEHFYLKKYYQIGSFERHPKKHASGYVLWTELSGQEIFSDARTYFHVDHGITVIDKQPDGCDFYSFGTTVDNASIITFYLNNIDLLRRFIIYFKDRASSLIKKARTEKIILPKLFDEHQFPDEQEKYMLSDIKGQFINAIKIKNFNLSNDLEGEVLKKAQLNCLVGITQGKTAKEIAQCFNLSYRTVEGHINKLKERFNCNSKSELLEKLYKNGLDLPLTIENTKLQR